MAGLTKPLPDLGAWVRYLAQAEIPVFAATAAALEELRPTDDALMEKIAPARLGAVIEADPLMTIKLMAHVATRRKHMDNALPETVLSLVVLTGIAPFFRQFGAQPTVEDRLQEHPEALSAVQALYLRSERAGRFALAFAVHRADPDAAVIRQSACLQDFAEMLVWCHAPELMLQVRAAQRAHPTLRSSHIQPEVLNVELEKLRQALLQHWHMPDLHTRSVQLASRLARHTEQGWGNPALPDDIQDIAQLLHATPRVALAYVKKVDGSADA